MNFSGRCRHADGLLEKIHTHTHTHTHTHKQKTVTNFSLSLRTRVHTHTPAQSSYCHLPHGAHRRWSGQPSVTLALGPRRRHRFSSLLTGDDSSTPGLSGRMHYLELTMPLILQMATESLLIYRPNRWPCLKRIYYGAPYAWGFKAVGIKEGLSGRQEGLQRSPCLETVGDWALLAHGCHARLAHLSQMGKAR